MRLLVTTLGLMLLATGCGLLIQDRHTTPPQRILVGSSGVAGTRSAPSYTVMVPFTVDGYGGNVHDPLSVRRYHYNDCHWFTVDRTDGEVDASHIHSIRTVRGTMSFTTDTISIQLEVAVYKDSSNQIKEWRPYEFNGVYQLKRTSVVSGRDCQIFSMAPDAY